MRFDDQTVGVHPATLARPQEPAADVRALCHDLRHELAVILALAELARTEPGLPDASVRSLDHVIRHTTYLAEQMADVVKHGARSTVDASATVRELVETVMLASSTAIVCSIEDGIMLASDAYSTRRAVMNLLDNAMRAAGPAGIVSLRLQTLFGSVVLEIEDSGPGFGECAPGLASVGLSVVADWVASMNAGFEIARAARGGTIARVVVGREAGAPTCWGMATT
jgi:signal transduction histidine kinase